MIRTDHPVPALTIGPTNANDHESKARVHPASPMIVAVIDDGTLRLDIAISGNMGGSKAVRKGPARTLFFGKGRRFLGGPSSLPTLTRYPAPSRARAS